MWDLLPRSGAKSPAKGPEDEEEVFRRVALADVAERKRAKELVIQQVPRGRVDGWNRNLLAVGVGFVPKVILSLSLSFFNVSHFP